MILPLVSAYFLIAWVLSYHHEKKVEEYYEVNETVQKIGNVLREPALYDVDAPKEKVTAFETEQLSITLYNKEGLALYTSDGETAFLQPNKEVIYRDLYELVQGLRFFTYKEPVFDKGEIVGLFEIDVTREEFMQTIVRRGWIVIGLFVTSFILIYAAIALFVHNRLNKRFNGLMAEMSAFASGDTQAETEVGKDEIGELKQHFYGMRKQITAAQEVIAMEQKANEYMVATISHDLKTPLTSIKAYAEALENTEDLTEQDKRTYRRVIIEKADFMKQMLDDLITHTLLQSQSYELELVPVDGEEFFDMLISGYEPLCDKKQIKLHTANNVTGDYDVNPQQCIRVVDNLMINAIRHTPEHGQIWIAALSAPMKEDWFYPYMTAHYRFDFTAYTYVIVQNEGEGIPENKIDYLFDPLYQVDQARSKKDAHGTGLGLSITQQIIEKHGGTIAVFSKVGGGACFVCSIPKGGQHT